MNEPDLAAPPTAGKKRPACPPHRLRPLRDEKGSLIGHGCKAKGCNQVFTVNGRVSQPELRTDNGLYVRPSKSHVKRVKAMRSRTRKVKK